MTYFVLIITWYIIVNVKNRERRRGKDTREEQLKFVDQHTKLYALSEKTLLIRFVFLFSLTMQYKVPK